MKRRLKPVTRFIGLLVLTSAGICAAISSGRPLLSATANACSIEQVALRTADGVLLNGVLYRPSVTPRSSAILLVHGFGGNFYEAYFPLFAQEAAAQGYATLALNMRDHDAGPKISSFTDNETDIGAGLAYLKKSGYLKFVLLGQSMGTNRVLYFEAVPNDSTIAATILVSGPGNLFEWNVWQLGREKAQASVDEARALEAAGREREIMLVDLGPLGKALYTPRYLLSLRGPEARSDPYQNIQKVKNPILILQGAADKLIAPDIATRLKKAATSNSKVDVIYVDGASHSFAGKETVLAERVLAWLKEAAP